MVATSRRKSPMHTNLIFVRRYGAYQPGDIAHFPHAIAGDIIAAGAAKLYDVPAVKTADAILPPRRGTKAITTKRV
jgi:hypothetical protein